MSNELSTRPELITITDGIILQNAASKDVTTRRTSSLIYSSYLVNISHADRTLPKDHNLLETASTQRLAYLVAECGLPLRLARRLQVLSFVIAQVLFIHMQSEHFQSRKSGERSRSAYGNESEGASSAATVTAQREGAL